MALLSKQAWRLITEPDLPIAQFFKAKYYPHSTFWEATLGARPSFTWRSILNTRHIIIQGSEWQLRDGKTIKLWGQKWVSYTATGHVITPPPDVETANTTFVADFIDREHERWDIIKLQNTLFPVDVQAILQIPLTHLSLPDKLVWTHSANGKFSVQGAYHIYKQLQEVVPDYEGPSEVVTNPIFRWIWGLQIQPKIKHFLWRSVTNSLPTATNLEKKNLLVEVSCKFCHGHREDIDHLFVSCPFVQDVNRHLGISPAMYGVHFFTEALEIRRVGLAPVLLEKWCVALWDLWHQRNNLLHGKQARTPDQIVLFVEGFYGRTRTARQLILKPPSLSFQC